MTSIKALIVGAGGMGKAWGRNLREHPDVEIAGWVDINSDTAKAAAEELRLGTVAISDDLGKALSDISPDFVVDVTVPSAHCEVTLRALAAGIPVIGEKPMADSMESARKMVAASEKSGKLYMVSQSRRYDARLHALRKLVDNSLGRLGILNSDFYLGAHFGGFRDEMAHVLVLDMAIHTFDAARFVSRANPMWVYCEEFNPGWSWYKGDACCTALFEMTGGVRYAYRGSWCSEGLDTSWEGEWRAVGSAGTAIWDGKGSPVAGVVTGTDGFHRDSKSLEGAVEAGFAGGIAGSLRDFLNALKTGQIPMGECHDNIHSLAMVFGAIESSGTGKRVKIQV